MENLKEQSYKEERFEFALYVNDNIICKRNFKINNFIEHSMETLEFKERLDEIVKMIDDDLKSKSRVYTWAYFNPDDPSYFDELVPKPLEPWESVFRFEVSDRHKVVISKIWDGWAYPKAIRDRVDLSNKTVKITTKDGKTYTYDKETFFKDNDNRLSFELQVLKAMIMDKSDLLLQITKKICETCSVHDDLFKNIGDYTRKEVWGKDASGKYVTYDFNIDARNKELEKQWAKWASEIAKKKKNS